MENRTGVVVSRPGIRNRVAATTTIAHFSMSSHLPVNSFADRFAMLAGARGQE